MKKLTFFLFAVVLVAAVSCKRTEEAKPVSQTVDQPNETLKVQDFPVTPIVIAGSFNHSGAADGAGTTAARFNRPMGIFTRTDGTLLVADYQNHAVRRISTGNSVTTPYHIAEFPTDVAAITDNAVGVVSDNRVTIFNHGTHVSRTVGCSHCAFVSIDKNPASTFFWHGENQFLGGPGSDMSLLFSINEAPGTPAPGIPITDDSITSFSIAANDNKFLTTFTQVLECTHGGTVFNVIPGTTFSGLTSIIANHDGTKLYVADAGVIKLITRCATCKPTLTILLGKVDATGVTLSNDEHILYFTSELHHTVSKVPLP